eukprot:CAMPEP_0118880438 /NCGR_PEP_ID=MMETSP1163-20130328/20009_1 /TAXON_ID=124430 /ORGANISM="Phaeomonas parva, Strain CCMP2877" /LENGTH=69 /DNA_ID=CAMNT_0006816847 /DNA_START=106 /DNA_END=315 /DNA_ORIENTATION=+
MLNPYVNFRRVGCVKYCLNWVGVQPATAATSASDMTRASTSKLQTRCRAFLVLTILMCTMQLSLAAMAL